MLPFGWTLRMPMRPISNFFFFFFMGAAILDVVSYQGGY